MKQEILRRLVFLSGVFVAKRTKTESKDPYHYDEPLRGILSGVFRAVAANA
jgi:hypothetical protein